MSVKSKLIIMLLFISCGPMLVISYLGWKTSRDTLTAIAFEQLTGVRTSKTYQLQTYIQFIRRHLATLGEDEMVIRAMVRLNKGFKQTEFELIPKEWDDLINEYYTERFFPQLSGEPHLEFFKPESTAAHYLQYWYIANNEYPAGQKHELHNAGDDSDYSQWHEQYHPLFANIQQRFGYYDMFLIDIESRNIVYSVFKEADYATNLATGPYSKSGLAEVVERTIREPEYGSVQVVDYRPYTPSFEAPAAFFATSIFNGPHIIGVLAIQLPVEAINTIMTGKQNWQVDGLGRSGETFLVGPDLLMRSVSRFLIENPEGYALALRKSKIPPEASFKITEQSLENLKSEDVPDDILKKLEAIKGREVRGEEKFLTILKDTIGEEQTVQYKLSILKHAPPETIKQIKQVKTSILFQKVDTEPAQLAVQGETGTQVSNNYRGIPVFSSYAPLHLKGLDWGILTEKDVVEVLQPLRAQQKKFFITGVILIVAITFIAVGLSNRFIQPLTAVISSAQQVEAGHHNIDVNVTSADEFGQLGQALSGIVVRMQAQHELLEQKNFENRKLIENVLPQGPAERLQKGEVVVADHVRQVTTLVASVTGFTELIEQQEAVEAVRMLNALWDLFNAAAIARGVEPHATMGTHYLAVCGLTGIYLDHAKRSLDFALELQTALQEFNATYTSDLTVQMGVHSGSIMAGIVGAQRFKYDLWGETLDVTIQLQATASPGTILVSQSVYEQVQERYGFSSHPPLKRHHQEPVPIWELQQLESC